MDKYTGKGVYGAIAIGKISVFKKRDADVKRVHVEDTENEKCRFEEAKTASVKQLGEIYQKALKEVGEANAAIFEIHQMMLDDEDYKRVYSSYVIGRKSRSFGNVKCNSRCKRFAHNRKQYQSDC